MHACIYKGLILTETVATRLSDHGKKYVSELHGIHLQETNNVCIYVIMRRASKCIDLHSPHNSSHA